MPPPPYEKPQALIYGFCSLLKYKKMEALTRPARPRFGGLGKYLKDVKHGLLAVTFIIVFASPGYYS